MADSPEEEWRAILSAPGYEVSSLGRVRGVERTVVTVDGRLRRYQRRVRKLTIHPRGHLVVGLSGKTRKVHQLVLESFVGPAPAGTEGCHSNGDPADNRLSNLRWDTHAANMLDKSKDGTWVQMLRAHCPLGHVLAAPNLVPCLARQGRRNCLACSRAQSRTVRHPEWKDPEHFARLAQSYYLKIMEDAA